MEFRANCERACSAARAGFVTIQRQSLHERHNQGQTRVRSAADRPHGDKSAPIAPRRPCPLRGRATRGCRLVTGHGARRASWRSRPLATGTRETRSARRTTKKCTEPVTLSSGFPTDLRRSDCHSESHQPPALRTRCMRDTKGARGGRQDPGCATSRKLRSFLFAQGRTAGAPTCSRPLERRKGAGPEGPATEP